MAARFLRKILCLPDIMTPVLSGCGAFAHMLRILLDMVVRNVASRTSGLSCGNGSVLCCLKKSAFLSFVSAETRQCSAGSARNGQLLARAWCSSSLSLHHD